MPRILNGIFQRLLQPFKLVGLGLALDQHPANVPRLRQRIEALPQIAVGDIVLVHFKGNDYLHLIKAISNGRFLIGNNRGGVNGWVGHNCIYGIAVEVESS